MSILTFTLQAILSSTEKRLTLNQIYDWLISSVMYFSERQDNVASSGWKVNLIQLMDLDDMTLPSELDPSQPLPAPAVCQGS